MRQERFKHPPMRVVAKDFFRHDARHFIKLVNHQCQDDKFSIFSVGYRRRRLAIVARPFGLELAVNFLHDVVDVLFFAVAQLDCQLHRIVATNEHIRMFVNDCQRPIHDPSLVFGGRQRSTIDYASHAKCHEGFGLFNCSQQTLRVAVG